MQERERPQAFFEFGSSGNVAEFKNKVVQHGAKAKPGPRKKALAQAKKIEGVLPEGARRPIRRIADSMGVTDVLTSDSEHRPGPTALEGSEVDPGCGDGW